MKLLFTPLLALIPLAASAQQVSGGYASLPKDSTTHRIAFQGIEQVSGATKAELFARAQEWAARSFIDSKSAGQIVDKDAGTVLYRATIRGNESLFGFVVAIYVKEGRYKYLVNDFTDKAFVPAESLQTPAERWEKFAGRSWAVKRSDELNKDVNALIASLRAAMRAQSAACKF